MREAAEFLAPGVIAQCCGSYRRGKLTCGDVDVLVTHSDGKSHKGLFSKLLAKLKENGKCSHCLFICLFGDISQTGWSTNSHQIFFIQNSSFEGDLFSQKMTTCPSSPLNSANSLSGWKGEKIKWSFCTCKSISSCLFQF